MTLEPPKIDDLTWQDLVDESLRRIRIHNPEWTSRGESDPGVTMLQLFAFVADSVLYRANRIPERNRIRFLQLLGIPLQPETSAQGIVTFTVDGAPTSSRRLAAGQQILAGKVPFRTTTAIDVVPVTAAVYYKRKVEPTDERRAAYELFYEGAIDVADLTFYETTLLEPPLDGAAIPSLDLGSPEIVDGSLWLALLAPSAEDVKRVRVALKSTELSVGVYPILPDEGKTLDPAGTAAMDSGSPRLLFEIVRDGGGAPRYEALSATSDVDVLTQPGIVRVRMPSDEAALTIPTAAEPGDEGTGRYPPSMADSDGADRVVTWIRVKPTSASDGSRVDAESDGSELNGGSGLRARIGWIGINAAWVEQRVDVYGELLGTGTGEPGQSFRLKNTPVLIDSVELSVDGETWTWIDDLARAGPEVAVRSPRTSARTTGETADAKVFTVDRKTGEVRFGDGERGARPPARGRIRADYRWGGGTAGNVNIGELTRSSTLPASIKVTNPVPTWGGDEPESTADAERNISAYVRHVDRLVAAQDFEDIAMRTPGVDLGRVDVLPLHHPDLPDVSSPGVVTLMVVPASDRRDPDYPVPSERALQLLCKHLEPRRLLTTELHVRGADYLTVHVSVGIEIAAGHDFPTVRDAVNAALRTFLSPLVGGRDGGGWPREKTVEARELWAEATRVAGVRYVAELMMANAASDPIDRLELVGVQLPRLGKVETTRGAPAPIDSLLSGTDGVDAVHDVVPVPVVPLEC